MGCTSSTSKNGLIYNAARSLPEERCNEPVASRTLFESPSNKNGKKMAMVTREEQARSLPAGKETTLPEELDVRMQQHTGEELKALGAALLQQVTEDNLVVAEAAPADPMFWHEVEVLALDPGYAYAYDVQEWPKFQGPSSRIIKQPSDWCESGILVPHEAFRWLHDAIRRILANFDPLEPGQDWKTPVFFNWLQRYYIVALHHHHDAEETIYNPAIVAKGGLLPPKITDDHTHIIEGLDKCIAFRTKIEAGDEAALIAFKTHLSELVDDIDDHLAEEEEAYPAALRSSTMTEVEEKAVVEKIIQSLGLDGNKILLPPIVFAMHMWAGKEQSEAFVNALPPPIKLAFERCWVNDFRANNLEVIIALQGKDEFSPRSPECQVCSIM